MNPILAELSFQQLFDIAADAMLLCDSNGRIVAVNPAATALLGYQATALTDLTIEKLLPERYARAHQLFREAFLLAPTKRAMGKGRELYVVRADGVELPVEVSLTPISSKGVSCILISLQDISRRKAAQQALAISENRLFISKQAAGLGVFDRDIASGELYLDQRAKQLWGFPPSVEAAHLTLHDFMMRVHVDDRNRLITSIELARQSAKHNVYHQDFRVHIPGELECERWLAMNGQVIFDGEVAVRHVGTFQDVTTQKRALNAIHDANERLKIFIHHAPISIAMFDTNMCYLSYSARWLQQYGKGMDDLTGQSHYSIYPNLPAKWTSVHRQVMAGATLENKDDAWWDEEGGVHWFSWTALPWIGDDAKVGGIIIAAEDIGTQKQLEQELTARRNDMEYMQKLYIASHTAAAIAHELNQPLAAISAYSEVALQALNSQTDQKETLKLALMGAVEQAQRAGKSLHELLNFLHEGKSTLAPFDLNEVVNKAIMFAKNDGFGGFHQRLAVQADLPPVFANRLQVEKVIINLLRNGAEALREKGKANGVITISLNTDATQTMAQVTIHDNGPGMSEHVAKQIFQPFFSTKSKGIGLGLATSRSMIEANGGQLWLDAEVKQGATFHFTLPFFLESAASSTPQH